MLRRTILLLAALSAIFPTVLADEPILERCVDSFPATVCADERHRGDRCETPNTTGERLTHARVEVAREVRVDLWGYEHCRHSRPGGWDERLTLQGITVLVVGPGTIVLVDWSYFQYAFGPWSNEQCRTAVSATTAGFGPIEHDLGCPAGRPPVLPWGDLLP